jgi:hypothetical protein
MRDLPLNGRNFEELILLAPGATVNQGAGAIKDSFSGNSTYWSVSGSRTSGQGEILDGTDIQNYQDRGSGSGVLGTTLGVDAIAEFQLLTNTYSARYGGNGSVVNAVTRSGANSLHGSLYEFLAIAHWMRATSPMPRGSHSKGINLEERSAGPSRKTRCSFFSITRACVRTWA